MVSAPPHAKHPRAWSTHNPHPPRQAEEEMPPVVQKHFMPLVRDLAEQAAQKVIAGVRKARPRRGHPRESDPCNDLVTTVQCEHCSKRPTQPTVA